MVKLLFVCSGNICRSPTAEGIMRDRIVKAGLETAIATDSAGTHGLHRGDPPDPRAIETAQSFGIAIGDLRARQVSRIDLDRFDIVVAMDRGHLRQLNGLANGTEKAEIRLLLPGRDVPDPYYDDDERFIEVYRLIEQGVDALFDQVKTKISGSSGS